jgi:SHS2 domain-containing protein
VEIAEERGTRLAAKVRGGRVDPERTRRGVDPKAVTFHRFALERAGNGWRARVVIDL